jgi:hypothetical protein
VGGEILRATIGFGLDDPPDAARRTVIVHEVHTNERAGDDQGIACVKVAS